MKKMVKMRKFLLFVVGILMCGSVYAGGPDSTKWITVLSSQTINSTAVVNSDPFDISNYEDFGFYLKVESGSSPNISAYYQVMPSMQGVTSLVGQTSVGEGTLSWVTPVSVSTMTTALTSGSVADAFTPMVSKWVRFAIKGGAGNGADTKASLYISGYSER